MRSLLALLFFISAIALVGCNEEPELNTLDEVQKESEGKTVDPNQGEAPTGNPLDPG